MRFSTHYYVLSFSAHTALLFEAFRDFLIGVENQGFPVVGPVARAGATEQEQRRELARTADRCFGHYFGPEPLGLVVVGPREMQAAFSAVTIHGAAILGRVEGDHSTTSERDLGRIAWSVVKAEMSGVLANALRDLDAFDQRGPVASGLEDVVRLASGGGRATLLVEDDYHLRGGIWGTDGLPAVTPDVDVRDTIDDAIDAVIEKVLASGGNVVFAPPGALRDRQRIVLLPRDTVGS